MWIRNMMAFCIWAILMMTLIVSVVHGDIGTATFYRPPYVPTRCGGSRQDQFPPGNRFVAVSDELWDHGAACGRRYRVRCLSGPKKACRHKTIEVKVVDFCPVTPCPSTIVLPKESFAAIARRHTRKINVEYIQV